MVTYWHAIQKAQGLERRAIEYMDAAQQKGSNLSRDTWEWLAESCAIDMEHWYQVARRLARGEQLHLWDIYL